MEIPGWGNLWDWALQTIGPFKGAAILAATQRLWHLKLSEGREGFARAIWLCLKSAFGVFNRSLACWSQIRGLPGCRGWDAGPASPAAAAPGRHGWQQLRGVRRDARPQGDWGARAAGRSHPQLPADCRHWASRGWACAGSRPTGQGSRWSRSRRRGWPRSSAASPVLPAWVGGHGAFSAWLPPGDRSCLPPPASFSLFRAATPHPVGATLPAGRGPGPPSPPPIPLLDRATCPVSPRGPRRSSWESLTRQKHSRHFESVGQGLGWERPESCQEPATSQIQRLLKKPGRPSTGFRGHWGWWGWGGGLMGARLLQLPARGWGWKVPGARAARSDFLAHQAGAEWISLVGTLRPPPLGKNSPQWPLTGGQPCKPAGDVLSLCSPTESPARGSALSAARRQTTFKPALCSIRIHGPQIFTPPHLEISISVFQGGEGGIKENHGHLKRRGSLQLL